MGRMGRVLVGFLVGVAAGAGATLYWKSLPASPDAVERPRASSPGAIPVDPPPAGHAANPHDAARAAGASDGGAGLDAGFAKVHLMRKFVAALAETPENLMPQPRYEPLLKPGAAMIRCADCHRDATLDFEGMIASDPGDEAVQPFRMRRRDFMIPLMEKWVARLNRDHADRLRKEVSCLDCHAEDPRDRNATMPPLMIRFVKALREPPRNDNPASGWKPLLKAPSSTSMLCADCHGAYGEAMERNLAALVGPEEPGGRRNRAFMIRLMERWVRELNKRARDKLVKAVVCIDCHEIDPRK